jgi:hypothetical protein
MRSGYQGSFPDEKQPGGGVDHPSPSSVEVIERVKLYIYFPCVSALHVTDRRLRSLCPKNEVTAKYNELGEEIIHKKIVTMIQPKRDWKAM